MDERRTPRQIGVRAEAVESTVIPSVLQPVVEGLAVLGSARRHEGKVDAEEIVERVPESGHESQVIPRPECLDLSPAALSRRVE